MKRILALVLAVTLLLSLFVAPVAAEAREISFDPAPSLDLTVVSYEVKGNIYISGTGTATTVQPNEPNNLFAVKLSLTNNAEKTLNWAGGQFFIKYDETAFEPYSFDYEDEDTGDVTTVGPIATALPKENDKFNYTNKWFQTVSTDVPGLIQFTKASGEGQKAISQNGTLTIAYILFKVKEDVENGARHFEFDLTRDNAVSAAEELNTESHNIAIDFSEIRSGDVSVTGGNLPELKSIKVEQTSETAVYGTAATFKLTALSTKGKDISDLVTFKVQEYFRTYITIDNDANTLTTTGTTTGTSTSAGTYHVYAEAVDGACTVPDGITGSFTIEKLQMDSLVVEIYNFKKGALITDATNGGCDEASEVTLTWYEGTGDEKREITDPVNETFKAATTYTVAITLTPYANYTFADDADLTVKGLGDDDQRTTLTANGDGTYSAAVTVMTADKDEPAITLKLISATYGDLLSKHEPTGTATFAGKPVEGEFAWSAEYGNDTTVGNVGKNTFNVVFTPTDEDNYKAVNGTVEVTVAKKEIDITDKLNEWSANEFTYDGKRHAVELKIDEDLAGIVRVEKYTGVTEAQNVGDYTAIASLELVDPDNYVFTAGTDLTRSHTWTINKGDLTPTNAEKSVLFGTKEVTVTPADFGLTQDGIEIVDVQTGTNLIQSYSVSTGKTSVTFTLRDTSKTDAADNTTDTATLKFSSANYNETSGTLTIKIIDKKTDADTLKIDVPATVTYGDTVTPSVGESKPAGAGDVTFKFFDEDNHEVFTTAQPFDAGTYKVTASCESESTIYTAEATFTVEPRKIEAKDVAFDKELTYTGSEQTQTVTVTVNGKTLTVGTDYTVSDLTGTEPGSYPVTVTGAGNYTGTATKYFEIVKADISSAEITYDAGPYGYTGAEWKPEVTVTFNGTKLTLDTDYTVAYTNNVNAGEATVTITGTGARFDGSVEKHFTIEAADLFGCTIASIAAVTYNTKPQEPGVTVTLGETTLTAADYDVSYSEDHTNAGTVTVTVTGKGNYTGTKTATFEIKKVDLKLNAYTISELCTEADTKTRTLPSDFFLAGEITTGFSITLTAVEGGDEIFAEAPAVVEGKNEITFKLNGKVGAAAFTVTVTPTSGNYNSGSYTLTISTYDRTDVSGSIEFKDGSAVYTGSGIAYERATLSGNSFNMDYSYRPASTGAKLDEEGLPLTVGTYTVTAIYSDANSYGSAQAVFTITKATPTGTPTCTKFESSGKTLADTELSVGTIRPAGTIAWDLLLTTVLEDGKAYAWTFTPNDTHNYTTLTGTLIPYVDDGMDYIPGIIGGSTTGSFTFHDVSRTDYFYNAVKWASENGIASGTSRYNFSPDAVCTRAQTVTFLWRAAGSPLPRYRVSPFTDVNASDYYYNAVLWAVEQGITTGLNATTFGPDETVTRGQVATFLYRAASAAKPNTFNPFTDVKSTAYNYDAILWAYDNRITTGTSDTTFSPNAFCTRAQIVTFLYRFYQGR